MGYKIFVDINIWVDLLNSERLNHLDAIKVIDMAEKGDCVAFVTESVLNTTAYLLRKDYSVPKLKGLFNHLLSFTELIPVTSIIYSKELQNALNDVEDAILYTAALNANIDYFITADLNDLKKLEVQELPVMTAKDFFNKASHQ